MRDFARCPSRLYVCVPRIAFHDRKTPHRNLTQHTKPPKHKQDSTQLGVFLAILAHKGLAGITLGSTMLLAAASQTQFLLTALVFSAATPFGVGIGVLISSYCKSELHSQGANHSKHVAKPAHHHLYLPHTLPPTTPTGTVALGLMAAVAAGTFIHVAAIEIIPSAFKDSSATQLAKLVSLTLGFLAMMALSLMTSQGRGGSG